MPFFKFENKFIYYAHVPKCGGSSVAYYLQDRFGELAFFDNQFAALGEGRRWTKSSPQHVDVGTLERMIPLHFFDAMFAIVRHPVARTISTFHFQRDVEKSIPEGMGLTEWLAALEPAQSHFQYDNHVLPMNRIVPPGAAVFHLEHGLDQLTLWLDKVTGNTNGPRAFEQVNKRGAYDKNPGAQKAQVEPTAEDLARIGTIYAEDFERFGYEVNSRAPQAAAPEITDAFIAAREAEIKRMNAPLRRLQRKVQRRLSKKLNS